MTKRQTRNVSLPPDQNAFVDDLVSSGRYRTASAVVRDGLRLLEEVEHRRLLEKWIYEGLSGDEKRRLPTALRERARAHFQALIDGAMRGVGRGRMSDGPAAMERLRAELESRLDDR